MRELTVSYPSPMLCRVALHTDTVHADLALPARIPIAALIPSVVDVLAGRGGEWRTARPAAPYRLARPGEAALDSSRTLAQHAIRDGTVLLLTRTPAEPSAPRFDDPAEQVSATVRSRARPWTPRAGRFTAVLAAGWLTTLGVVLSIRASGTVAAAMAAAGAGCALIAALFAHRVHQDGGTGLALGLFAVGLAAVAGFVAVPGGPAAPNTLLAATAAAAVAVLSMQLAGCGGPAMTAVCVLMVLTAAAALTVVLTGVSPRVAGALAVVTTMGLLQAAARVSMVVAGLARRPQALSACTDDRACRAHQLLTGLVVAFSVAAALGGLGAALGGAPRFEGAAFAAATGAALLLQARSHTDRFRI
ncbi:MAG TPA: type VII secretion integral membrane protein EccD, partial [Mycobacterium sp.]|nr:type VII secretion integral membrane protein EccD [Mycobacterium sp.]